jgi:hypothetical protein
MWVIHIWKLIAQHLNSSFLASYLTVSKSILYAEMLDLILISVQYHIQKLHFALSSGVPIELFLISNL